LAIVLCASAVSAEGADEPKVNVLIAYHSRTGNTAKMAEAVRSGAAELPGTHAVLKQVDQVSKEDLIAADGLILGCPTYYANLPGAMKVVIDDWSWKMKVDFTDKVGGAFATGGGQTGGKEHAVASLLLFMINLRMVVAGPLYQDEEGDDVWAELGATAVTGPTDLGVSAAELDAARRVGRRIAELAHKLHGR
jgi:NAD(P)H dehydrogenase (quinone)